MITTVLFDLFGTLIELQHNSCPYHALVKRLSTPNTRGALRQSLVNNCSSLAEFARLIGLPVQKDIGILEAELMRDIDSATLFEDSPPTLIKLKKKGIKIGLISNLASPYRRPVKDLELEKYFDVIVFSCELGVAKPDPEIYKFALTKLGSAADETLMVGDSFKADIEGPANAGITGLHLVRNGGHSKSNEIRRLDEVLERI
ncbi:MAG: HAD family hydrolase [Bermanella sp.]